MVAAVFDVVPDSQSDGQQLVPDALVVADRVQMAAPLDPPVAVFPAGDLAEPQVLARHFARPGRRRERHGAAVVARGEQDARAERFAVGFLRREAFAELGASFAAGAELGARLDSEARIACRIHVQGGPDAVNVLALVAARQHVADAAVFDGGAVEDRFEQQGDVRFAHHLVIQQQVPHLPGALRVAHGVFEPQLFDQPALAPAGAPLVAVGADDVHLHLARGVAAQPGPVLKQDDAQSVARRGDGRAHAGQPAARHQQVRLQIHQRHVGLVNLGGG